MLIIAGPVFVDPDRRDDFVARHQVIVEEARAHAPGCLDVVISADPTDPGRVHLFEMWESEEQLAAWRAVSPAPNGPVAPILRDAVRKYQVSSPGPPF